MSGEISRPFLKWAGGKRALLGAFRPLLPSRVERMRLVEPFAGGAALFFASSGAAQLSDINGALIETYRAVRSSVENVISHLGELAACHGEEQYYRVRERHNARAFACPEEAAAAFIYLNKTCFNGLYRVNRAGSFNVPMGRYAKPNILDAAALCAASARLQDAELHVDSFEVALERSEPGDFVYLDPPYAPLSSTANFASYAAAGFDAAQQRRLRDAFAELGRRGVKAMLSNSDTVFVRELYREWDVREVQARRSVGCSVASRGAVRELVIRNYA